MSAAEWPARRVALPVMGVPGRAAREAMEDHLDVEDQA
jgi:hypothetical protein